MSKLHEAVEREILELLAEHGEMTTDQVRRKVKTGRRIKPGGWFEPWSMTFIRERLYELVPPVTWREAWWGGPGGVRQYIWGLPDPPESKDDE